MRKRHMLSPILATRRHSGSLKVRPVIDVLYTVCLHRDERFASFEKKKKKKENKNTGNGRITML